MYGSKATSPTDVDSYSNLSLISTWLRQITYLRKAVSFETIWLALEDTTLSKINQTEKDKYAYDHTHVKSKNNHNKTKLIDIENKLVVSRTGGGK